MNSETGDDGYIIIKSNRIIVLGPSDFHQRETQRSEVSKSRTKDSLGPFNVTPPRQKKFQIEIVVT